MQASTHINKFYMSKSKLILTIALLFAGASPALGDGRIAIDPTAEGAEPAYVELTLATKVSFGPEAMIVTNGDNSVRFDYAAISRVRFEVGLPSGVNNVMQERTTLSLRQNPVENTLEILGYDGAPATLSVFSVSGAKALTLAGWQGETVDVALLAPGLYLVTVNNETLKFLKK